MKASAGNANINRSALLVPVGRNRKIGACVMTGFGE
tara:strand:- start:80261 stop:80368 length:108 start_codon:yes stop_codon:yes gene_type:complete